MFIGLSKENILRTDQDLS